MHWPITTKYYRADLALHLAETDEQPAEGVEEGNMHPLVARGEDLQGLILLCEASVPPDEEPDAQLARLKPWYGVECGPRVCVCVCVCVMCLCVRVCLLVLMMCFPHRIQDGRCLVPGRAGAVPGRGGRGRRGSSGRGRGRGRRHTTKTTHALVRKWLGCLNVSVMMLMSSSHNAWWTQVLGLRL